MKAYNMLGCPQCCNPLVDHLHQFEKDSQIKTVKCSNFTCDYIGSRIGFELFPLIKPNSTKYKQINESATPSKCYQTI
jgi:hypothetical protein